MARTRIDPWLTEQPDVVWRQSTLASIIPDVPYFPPNDCQNKTPKMIKVLLPNAGVHPQTDIWSNSKPKTFYHPSPLKAKSPFQEAQLSSPKKKHKSKHFKRRHKSNDEFEAAASKVLAALNMSQENPENQEPDDFEYEPKPKKANRLSLPDDDKRKNMVPKVVLRDIGKLISKVCPKLSAKTEESTSAGSSPSASKILATSAGSSPSTPKKLPMSAGVGSSPSASKKSSTSDPSASMKSPTTAGSSPSASIKSPTAASSSPSASKKLLFTSSGRSPLSPTKFQLPALGEQPIVSLDDVGSPNPHSMSAPEISKPSMKTSCERDNVGIASSEKSFAPFSKKETTFAALASAAPSFSKSPIASPSSFSWPSSAKLLPSNPVESDSSKLSSKFLSLLPNSAVPVDESKPSNKINPRLTRSSLKPSQVTEKWKTNHTVPDVPIYNSKPSVPIKNGFLGFSVEDSKKLRVCFHVNTNILASSLDLLDLHKHSEIPSGSPSTCPHCNVTFSSVKHCKYHQSFTSSDVSLAPSRHNNIQENDLWLCPWCPLMSTTVMLLNSHKKKCREKGRCQQEEKASSVRKNAPISSSRRKSPTSAASNGAFISPSKYKVVHGEVIQL